MSLGGTLSGISAPGVFNTGAARSTSRSTADGPSAACTWLIPTAAMTAIIETKRPGKLNGLVFIRPSLPRDESHYE